MSKSMHDGVETWCDTCSCEPEPRWQALAEEWEEAEDLGRAEAERRDERQSDSARSDYRS